MSEDNKVVMEQLLMEKEDMLQQIKRLQKEKEDMLRMIQESYRRFVYPDKRPKKGEAPKKKQSFITGRLIALGFMQKEYFDNVLQETKVIDPEDGLEIPQSHPHQRKLTSRRLIMSKLLAKKKKELDGELPPICSTDRTNFYTDDEMDEWGDSIIKDYVWKFPIDDWGIKWDRGMTHKRIPLTHQQLVELCDKQNV